MISKGPAYVHASSNNDWFYIPTIKTRIAVPPLGNYWHFVWVEVFICNVPINLPHMCFYKIESFIVFPLQDFFDVSLKRKREYKFVRICAAYPITVGNFFIQIIYFINFYSIIHTIGELERDNFNFLRFGLFPDYF